MQSPSVEALFVPDRQGMRAFGWTASGWLLSLDTQSLNDCCGREQTVKNITGSFPEPQELTQLLWSLVGNGI